MLVSGLNLRHLRLLLEIERQGAFGRAAEAVALSHSAATQGVQKLEATLAVRLCERARAGARLSGAGRVLAARVERAMAWLRAGDDEIRRAVPGRRGPPPLEAASLPHLRALIAVSHHGSFSLAAHALGLSQPTAHRAARELEARCGVELFRASPQGVEPSPLARALARCVGIALSELEQGAAELREHQGVVEGRVTIGALPLSRSEIIPAAVTALTRAYPLATVEIIDGPYRDLLDGLRHGRVDLMVGALREPPPTPDLRQEPLFKDPLSIVVRAGHGLAGPDAASTEALAGLNWIAPRLGTPGRAQFERFLQDRGLARPEGVIECSSLVAIRGLLVRGDRATLLSERQVRHELDLGVLATVGPPVAGTARRIGITLRADFRPTRLQARLLDLVRQAQRLDDEGAAGGAQLDADRGSGGLQGCSMD